VCGEVTHLTQAHLVCVLQVLSSLFEPIKRDLHLSDAQLGVLGGLAVALFGALFGVHIARAADAAPSRRFVLVLCLVAWSIATACSGAAPGFWSLLVCRILVGVGEAGCVPISLAILADAYPQQRRSVAMSIFYMGLPGGIMLGLFAGGWLAQGTSWRLAFLAVGIPGLALAAVVMIFLREPPRGYADEHEDGLPAAPPDQLEGDTAALLPANSQRTPAAATAKPKLAAQLLALARCRTFVHVMIGGALNLFTAIGTFAFMPSLCTRRFGTEPGVAGTALSGAMIFGAVCTLAGGVVCDRQFRRTRRLGVYASLPAACALLGFPFGCALCKAPSFGLTIVLFLPPTLAANVPSGPLRCLTSALIPPANRAAANSVLEIGIGLAGGLGPLAVGALSDAAQRRGYDSATALSNALLIIQFFELPAAFFLWRAAVNAEPDARKCDAMKDALALQDEAARASDDHCEPKDRELVHRQTTTMDGATSVAPAEVIVDPWSADAQM
jgi:predicted MFS family arabinose efflux permease